MGRIKVRRVMSFPRLSKRDQIKRPKVTTERPKIPRILKLLSKNCIPINPRERIKEVITNFLRLVTFRQIKLRPDLLYHPEYQGWKRHSGHHHDRLKDP